MRGVLIALVTNTKSRSAPQAAELAPQLAGDGAHRIHDVSIDEVSAETLGAHGTPDRVVVAGGDGSVGISALAATALGVPLAVIPAGTANDFARAKGIPLARAAACRLAADPDARIAYAELGMVGDRPFVNAAAAGLSVDAAQRASQHKKRLGALAYPLGALKAAAKARTLHCVVRVDGEQVHDDDVWQVVVGVTGAFGGGSEIGGTIVGDSQLDVAVIPAGSRVGLARRAYGMRRGKLTAQRDITHVQGRVIEIEGPEDFNVDGELCPCTPARFELREGGFAAVLPA